MKPLKPVPIGDRFQVSPLHMHRGLKRATPRRTRALNQARVRRHRSRAENGIGCVTVTANLEDLAYLLNLAMPPQPGSPPFTSEDRKALAEGVVRLLERLLQETRFGHGGDGVV